MKIDNMVKEEKRNIYEHDDIKIKRCNKTDETGRSEGRKGKEIIHIKIIVRNIFKKIS